MLQDTLARVESRDSDGIITPSLVHIAASIEEFACVLERVNAARGRLLSVRERLDTSTRSGRRMIELVVSLAELSYHDVRCAA